MNEVKPVVDGVVKTVSAGVEALSKAWSVMEAASEKPRTSEYLSPDAVRRIQGQRPGEGA